MMSGLLNDLIITPLYLLFEIVFEKAYAVTGNYGVSIIVLSLCINILVFPLYRAADAMQREEREKEKKLAKWTEHIKKTFKGDERYMMLQTYYRQNNFKQTDSLKGTVSLVLQIPFFIAAYRFLSGLQQLSGVSFGPLADLSKPDALLSFGGTAVNLLPLLMTGINLLSGAVYTRGMPLKSLIQLYITALVFLVLLYRSPSGLVFYWTLNNLFSLIKNLLYKAKDPGGIVCFIAALAGALMIVFAGTKMGGVSLFKRACVFGLGLILYFPTLWRLFSGRKEFRIPCLLSGENSIVPESVLFWLAVLYLTCLVGFLIPSSVISASPEEFVDADHFRNPLQLVYYSFTVAAGCFLVWLNVFRMLFPTRLRNGLNLVLWVLAGIATTNYMFFGKKLGNMSPDLVFDWGVRFPAKDKVINLLAIFVISACLVLVYKKKRHIIPVLFLAVLAGSGTLIALNIVKVQDGLKNVKLLAEQDEGRTAEIRLSRNGKNVVVIMLDRALGPYVPYLFHEKPELLDKLSGFTYYSNTVSTGAYTNAGLPSVFGGYEYSPLEMNKRSSESLKDKHDEAMCLMPFLFEKQGYQVTVCDPTYAGYLRSGDLSVYEGHASIEAYHIKGRFETDIQKDHEKVQKRNLFVYSVMKTLPLFLQHSFYNGGKYMNLDDSNSTDYNRQFLNSYSVLENLPAITRFSDGENNTFLMMTNEATHEPCDLQLPEYKPGRHIDFDINQSYENEHKDRFVLDGMELKADEPVQLQHYNVNMAVLLKMGDWFDYLKEQGVYDNTRIILVADHGRGLGQFDRLTSREGFDLEWFTPLLMVKDFDAEVFSSSEEFMTTADTPLLAMQDMIPAPENPFTGKKLTSDYKNNGDVTVFYSKVWNIEKNNGNVFKEDEGNRWFRVHDNIWDPENWEMVQGPET